MTDQLCVHAQSIPLQILYFCKAIYDYHMLEDLCQENKKLREKTAFQSIGKFLIEEWLNKAAFDDTILHGFSRSFILNQNAISNIQLIGTCLSKIFQFDETPYKDEVL